MSHAIYFVFTDVESILFILEIKQESINVYWCGGMIVIVINMASQGSLFNPCFPLAQLMSWDTRLNKLEMKLFLIRINIFKSIFRCNISTQRTSTLPSWIASQQGDTTDNILDEEKLCNLSPKSS